MPLSREPGAHPSPSLRAFYVFDNFSANRCRGAQCPVAAPVVLLPPSNQPLSLGPEIVPQLPGTPCDPWELIAKAMACFNGRLGQRIPAFLLLQGNRIYRDPYRFTLCPAVTIRSEAPQRSRSRRPGTARAPTSSG